MAEYGLLIDYEFCSGCHSCEVACKEEHGFPVGKHGIRLYDDGPWQIDNHKTNWNKIPVPTDLCDLCAERTAAGKKPTCVHHCLADVMRFGTIDELAQELKKKGKQVLFVPRPGIGLNWQEEIDSSSVVANTRGLKIEVDYRGEDAANLEDVELNKSFKLVLQRDEHKLDETSDMDALEKKLRSESE
jgi:anaerobic dimethyl sulfoxide reductase subunit B (iron-sulfur subunit)